MGNIYQLIMGGYTIANEITDAREVVNVKLADTDKIIFTTNFKHYRLNYNSTIVYAFGDYFTKERNPQEHQSDTLTRTIIHNKRNKSVIFPLIGCFYVEYLLREGILESDMSKIAIVSPPSAAGKRDQLKDWRSYVMKQYGISVDLTDQLVKTRNNQIKKDDDPESLYQLKEGYQKLTNIDEIWLLDDMVSTRKTISLIIPLIQKISPNSTIMVISMSSPM